MKQLFLYRSRWHGWIAVCSLLLCCLIASQGWGEDQDGTVATPRPLVLITHVQNPAIEISRREIGRIYLKRKRYWVNAERCVPIDQRGSSAMRKDFYRLILDKDLHEVKRYWMQQTMTGNGTPPITLDNSTIVKRYVRKIKGGIGYIYADEVDATVKVLHVVDMPIFNSTEESVPKPQDDEEDTHAEATTP